LYVLLKMKWTETFGDISIRWASDSSKVLVHVKIMSIDFDFKKVSVQVSCLRDFCKESNSSKEIKEAVLCVYQKYSNLEYGVNFFS